MIKDGIESIRSICYLKIHFFLNYFWFDIKSHQNYTYMNAFAKVMKTQTFIKWRISGIVTHY